MNKEDILKRIFFKINDFELEKLCIDQESAKWAPEDIKYGQDLVEWKKLSESEKNLVKCVLSFSIIADTIVNINIAENLIKMFPDEPSIERFYKFQSFIETVHKRAYTDMSRTVIRDPEEFNQIANSFEYMRSINLKLAWINSCIDNGPKNVLGFVIVEGVFFSSLFAVFYWLKGYKNIPGMCQANEFIARDENSHCSFGVKVYNKYVKEKLSQEETIKMFHDAIKIEYAFIEEAFNGDIVIMTRENMKNHVKFVANFWASQILCSDGKFCKYPFPENIASPFQFIEKLSLFNTKNIFEQPTTSYISLNNVDIDNDFTSDDI